MRFISVVLIMFIADIAYCQTTVEGKILNKKTREPIVYANIGIEGADVGTLSNADGTFSLLIPDKQSNDTLVFSALGFVIRKIAIPLLMQKQNIILLNERTIVLSSVVVTGSKQHNRKFELGNPVVRGGVLETDTSYAGRSIALLITNNESSKKKGLLFPVYLEQARIRIYRNNLASFKFRVRVNELDSITGKPGKDILQQNIVMESMMKNGWLKFDLSYLNFKVFGPFFITFEQILDKSGRTAVADGFKKFIAEHPTALKTDTVMFEGKKIVRQSVPRMGINMPGTFIGISNSKSAQESNSSFVRETSLGEWTKVRGIVSAMVTLSNQASGSNTAAPESADPAISKIQVICEEFVAETGMNGMQLSIIQKSNTRFLFSFGYADIEKGIHVNDSTKFRINSISKSMTAFAMVRLALQDKLKLDVPIQEYVPEFPSKKYPVTLRQLSGHLAGIRDYNEKDLTDFIRTTHYDNTIQTIDIIKNDTLVFKPGTRFHYSTFGWSLIGAAIERVSHQDYLSYMSLNVWKPMKLKSVGGDISNVNIPNRSKLYDQAGEENDFGDVSYKYPGGGLLSSARDLAMFGDLIMREVKTNAGMSKLLFESQRTSDGKETGYGMGWYVGKDRNDHRIWYHGGDGFSSSSFLILYPDDDLVIAFVGNSQDGVNFDVQKIGELVYKN